MTNDLLPDTAEEWFNFEMSIRDKHTLFCLDGVCVHSPNHPSCRRDMECKNFDEGAGFHQYNGVLVPNVDEDDFERCFDCGALMWWAIAPNNYASELMIEPHSKTCWHTRNDPGGYVYEAKVFPDSGSRKVNS